MSEATRLRVLVTGGGSGIGLAIARHLCQSGARVHICDVSEEVLRAATATLSGASGTTRLCIPV